MASTACSPNRLSSFTRRSAAVSFEDACICMFMFMFMEWDIAGRDEAAKAAATSRPATANVASEAVITRVRVIRCTSFFGELMCDGGTHSANRANRFIRHLRCTGESVGRLRGRDVWVAAPAAANRLLLGDLVDRRQADQAVDDAADHVGLAEVEA